MATLSVIMPNFNHAPFIRRALESIRLQSRPADEIVIVDDGSTDESVEVIEACAREMPGIRLFKNDVNMGTVFTANRALQAATGDYIAQLASDDVVMPGFFEKSLALLARHPEAAFCCSDIILIDDATAAVTEYRCGWSETPRYFAPAELVEMLRTVGIATNTLIMRRTLALEMGGYLTDLKWHSDWFIALVLAFRGGFCYIPEPLGSWRICSTSFSSRGMKNTAAQRQVVSDLIRILKSPPFQDILPSFQRSEVMLQCDAPGVGLLMANPTHWNLDSFELLRPLLRRELEKTIQAVPFMARFAGRF